MILLAQSMEGRWLLGLDPSTTDKYMNAPAEDGEDSGSNLQDGYDIIKSIKML